VLTGQLLLSAVKKLLSACLNARLCLMRFTLTVLLAFEFSEIPG